MKLIYCAHSHITTDWSHSIAVFVLKKGYIPIDPFLTLPPEIYDYLGFNEEDCINTDIHLLAHCEELWVFGDRTTPGVSKEINWWKQNRLSRIRYFSLDEVPKLNFCAQNIQ